MTKEELDFIGAMNMCDEISNEAYKKIVCHCEAQEPCDDCISREAARDLMYHKQEPLDEYDLDTLPSVTPKPKEGHWIYNLCESCTNIGCEFQSGIVRTKCAFYMPPHIESDNCGNYVVMQEPSAQPEIIKCKDCKYWREHKYAKETKRYIPFCGFNAIYTKSDDFCSRAERRENDKR